MTPISVTTTGFVSFTVGGGRPATMLRLPLNEHLRQGSYGNFNNVEMYCLRARISFERKDCLRLPSPAGCPQVVQGREPEQAITASPSTQATTHEATATLAHTP